LALLVPARAAILATISVARITQLRRQVRRRQ
jgi:hypothetical protein